MNNRAASKHPSSEQRRLDQIDAARRQGAQDGMFGPGQPDVTLQPAALVNEAFIKLIKQRQRYDDRGQFFAIATKLMIRLLMDYHRKRKPAKRGGERAGVPLEVDPNVPVGQTTDAAGELASVVKALEKLEKLDSRKADVVKSRVFWWLSLDEIAESLGVARATVERDWSFAKAWLKKEIAEMRPAESL